MKLKTLLIFCNISFCCAEDYLIADPVKIVDLQTGFINTIDDYYNETYVSSTPNGIYSIAKRVNLIDNNILAGFEVNSSKWIAWEKWVFRYQFDDDDRLTRNNVLLVFDGLDTIAEVKFNDYPLGITNNMFVQHIFDIKDYLQESNNTIEVILDSPLESAIEAYLIQNTSYSIPPECPSPLYHGDCHINMLRKMQASFSSSFGPSVPSSGLWKPAYILRYKQSYIQHVVVDLENLNETYWRINMDVYLSKNRMEDRIYGRMNLIFNGFSLGTMGNWWVDVGENEYGEFIWSNYIDIEKESVELWWPNGYGQQPLYNLTVQYYSSDLREGSQKTVRIGFRTIELIQNEIENGLSFYFKVNDVPIFMKGSNVVPLDILPEKAEIKETIQRLIKNAVDSSMNMLRIWGGGFYGADYLYDLADIYGILIWQDFMFVNSLYPANEAFLNNVRQEVSYQVKRLHNHPSLALFSGNFEIEQALAENWYGIENLTRYQNDYVELFINNIKQEVDRITQGKAIFVYSSPSNGYQTENEGFISNNPNDEIFGDIHYFNYEDDPFDQSKFPIPRFASAYGLQSLPNTESILNQVLSNDYLSIYKELLIYRQHQSYGYDEMLNLIEINFDLPNLNDSYYDISFFYYSQVTQGHNLRLQNEHYRSYKSVLNEEGKGNTMGALYWHMNDVWIAPTWSGIDYYGRWKLTQYLVRDSFVPVIVTGKIVDSDLNLYIISDLLETINMVNLHIKVYQWNSFVPVHEVQIEIEEILPVSELVATFNIEELFANSNCTRETCFFYLTLEKDGTLIAPNNQVFPATLKYCSLIKHSITVQSVKKLNYKNIYEVTIVAKNIAAFVFIDAHYIDGKFSENGFVMVDPSKIVYFYSETDTSEEDLMKMLTVTHIRDWN